MLAVNLGTHLCTSHTARSAYVTVHYMHCSTMHHATRTTRRCMRRTAYALPPPSNTTSGHAPLGSLDSQCGACKLHSSRHIPTSPPYRGRKKGKRVYQFPNSLQLHIDREDRRIKDLTEGILYEFLPAALNVMVPISDDVGSELKPDRCRVRGRCRHHARWYTAPPWLCTGGGWCCAVRCQPHERAPRLSRISLLRPLEQPR